MRVARSRPYSITLFSLSFSLCSIFFYFLIRIQLFSQYPSPAVRQAVTVFARSTVTITIHVYRVEKKYRLGENWFAPILCVSITRLAHRVTLDSRIPVRSIFFSPSSATAGCRCSRAVKFDGCARVRAGEAISVVDAL